MSTTLNRSIEYIENHLTEPASVEEAAAAAGYSRYHFSRTFLAATGLTPAGYLRKRRLSEAARELVISRRRILDIALDYQFSSPEAFTRSFRSEFGVNPALYRQRGRLRQLWGTISLGLTNLLYPGQGIDGSPKLVIPETKIIDTVMNLQDHPKRIPPTPGTESMAKLTDKIMDPFTIRQAQRQDIPTLCRLYHELHEFTTNGILQQGGLQRLQSLGDIEQFDASALSLSLRKLIDTVDVALFVAEYQSNVVGLAEVYLREDEANEMRVSYRYGHLQSLIVTQSMRGVGLGKQLLQAVETWSREQGASELRLDTWEFEQGPLHFYKRQDYRTLRRTLVREL